MATPAAPPGIRANDGRVYVTYLGKKVPLVSLCELWELEGATLTDEDRRPEHLVRNLRPPQPPDPLRELLVGVCAGCGWQAIALHECIVHYPDLGNLRRREYWCPRGHDIYAEDLFIPPIVCTWSEAEHPAREAYLKGITQQERAWRHRSTIAESGDLMDGVYPCPACRSGCETRRG